jgi:protein-disulfide isomerase
MNVRQHFELTAPVNDADHSLGPVHAPVTLVEYGDFECPNCKQAAPAVKLLFEQFPNKIRLVYRHFPVEQVHPLALNAAEAAECAGSQGQFWQMHDLLFDNQPHFKPPQLRHYAEQLQLDMAEFTAEMDDEIYRQRIREHQASGNASGVRGTPTFYLDGHLLDVSFGLHALVDGIEAALRNRKAR